MTHLPLRWRLNVRVAWLTDDIINVTQRTLGHATKGGCAVVGEVAVDLPGTAKICRPLNQHGRRTESLQEENVDRSVFARKIQHKWSCRSLFSDTCSYRSISWRQELLTHLEGHNQVSEMKLCFQIQLDKNIRLSWKRHSERERC